MQHGKAAAPVQGLSDTGVCGHSLNSWKATYLRAKPTCLKGNSLFVKPAYGDTEIYRPERYWVEQPHTTTGLQHTINSGIELLNLASLSSVSPIMCRLDKEGVTFEMCCLCPMIFHKFKEQLHMPLPDVTEVGHQGLAATLLCYIRTSKLWLHHASEDVT